MISGAGSRPPPVSLLYATESLHNGVHIHLPRNFGAVRTCLELFMSGQGFFRAVQIYQGFFERFNSTLPFLLLFWRPFCWVRRMSCTREHSLDLISSAQAHFGLTESVSGVVLQSRFPQKSVNLFFISVIVKNQSTDLWGSWRLQNDIQRTLFEINSQTMRNAHLSKQLGVDWFESINPFLLREWGT